MRPRLTQNTELWFLPIHRYYIQTEILHFTIILHVSYKKTCRLMKTLIVAMQRPWLLRRLKSSRYNLSRTACFDAAITDYKIVSYIISEAHPAKNKQLIENTL